MSEPDRGSIHVLVVDDSSFMRNAITHLLTSDTSIEVIAAANGGKDALRKTRMLKPDVVLMDIDMPVMDGLTALSLIMEQTPTPVVMLSGLSDAAVAIKSLELGAVDFVPKPSGRISYDIGKIKDDIISKVKVAAGVDIQKIIRRIKARKQKLRKPSKKKEMVVMGASTGGPRAIISILSGLKRDTAAVFLVVQHMSADFLPSFVERLKSTCPLCVSAAKNDEAIQQGHVYVAPGGCSIRVVKEDRVKKVRYDFEPSAHAVFPSIDAAMKSAANAYNGSALGVLLTGIGSDGAIGMKAIKDAGGCTIAEDKSTCLAFGMPKAAIELGCVDEVLPLQEIAPAITSMLGRV